MAVVVSSTLADEPFFLQKDVGAADPIYYSAADFRRFFTGIMPRTGILGSAHFLVTQADNVSMKVKVNSGYAVVGRYLVHSPNDESIELGSPFTGDPPDARTHKVYLTVYNELEQGTGFAAKIEVVMDEGSGANPPAGAANYLQLATVTVAPGQGNIQNQHINNTVRHGGNAAEYTYLDPYLATGISVSGTGIEPRALYTNGFVRLSGSIKRSNGDPFAAGDDTIIGTMHSNLRPSRGVVLIGATSISTGSASGYAWRLTIGTDGTMTARLPNNQAPDNLIFDGMSYDLD